MSSTFSLSGLWLLVALAGATAALAALAALAANLTGYLPLAAAAAKLSRSVSLAVKSLWLHKLRSFLSVLGIIIGTCSVIALMSFGEGSMQDALDDIKRQGATNIIVRSVKPPDDSSSASRGFVSAYGLAREDLDQFDTFGDVVELVVPMRVFPTEARYMDRVVSNARVIATVPGYQTVNKLELSRGRFLIDGDDSELDNYCVLGAEAADKLFPYEDPIGHTVGIRGHFFRVVGVVRERSPTGGTGGSQAAEDFNRDIYIPIRTSRRRFGEVISIRTAGAFSREQVFISQVTLTVNAQVDKPDGRAKVQAVGNEIKSILEKRHPKRDWAVTVPLDKLEEAERAQERFTMLMGIIAFISMVVGGIGIMNIMLATVTERTREIGIRRALGAKRKDIVLQFLVEAVVQTTLGGLCGAVIGIMSVYIVPALWDLLLSWGWAAGARLPAKLHIGSIFLSVGVSILVGMAFGLYPAWRAAKLDPIEALRHV
ncbi:ABC transporter permease [Frigoriglobus tundricola]|uniref:ABC-type antimicrobial peptide transport system, permease component n=1 Tax=Frigoriglobus tundricola TaxID=2774151 RepID=A0A6M5YHT0_9BACT|nr:ABC transporter permease [Frigoriglobus tundricola]QJW93629.1 ABC-type antimicrobial peptide transport system, permease component [Frigoriglobus tundricola]